MNDDRVDWHLWNWANFQRRPADASHLQHRKKASSGIGRTNSQTFDDMCDAADARCADATNVAIEDLPKWDKAAVKHHHLENYPAPDLPTQAIALYYRAACIEIGRKLDRAGIV